MNKSEAIAHMISKVEEIERERLAAHFSIDATKQKKEAVDGITGKMLPWDQFKAPIFPADVIDEIKRLCDEHQVEFELISKLIIEIEANKNYTNNSMVTKAFDRIINQGWLHFDSIEKGLQNENQ